MNKPIANPDTLIAVSAYAGDLNQVQNNMSFYTHHGCPVVILSPVDAPIRGLTNKGVECREAGLKGWIGKHTLERQILFLRILLEYPKNFYLFNDADSLCLSPDIPRYLYQHGDVLWSNEVPDTNTGPSLLPKIALQPPYFLTRAVVEGLIKAASNPATSYTCPAPTTSPEGTVMPIPTDCIDHYMLQLVHATRYEHRSFHDGASFETSNTSSLETMTGLVRDHGRVLIHQVKTRIALRALHSARLQYNRTHGRLRV